MGSVLCVDSHHVSPTESESTRIFFEPHIIGHEAVLSSVALVEPSLLLVCTADGIVASIVIFYFSPLVSPLEADITIAVDKPIIAILQSLLNVD